jgi:hypothetical protein
MQLEYFVPISAVIGFLIGRYLKLSQNEKTYHFQNIGEQIVSDALMNYLPVGSYHLLNNVTLKVDDGTTQVDHVLVSRYGVFVIETKHYSGWIFGDAHTREWTQTTISRFGPNKYKFMNPLHQNYKHIKAIQSTLDFIPQENIMGLVVFTGDGEFRTEIPSGVFSLDTMVDHMRTFSTEVMTENRMQFCIGRLEFNRLALTKETDIEHQTNLAVRRKSINKLFL